MSMIGVDYLYVPAMHEFSLLMGIVQDKPFFVYDHPFLFCSLQNIRSIMNSLYHSMTVVYVFFSSSKKLCSCGIKLKTKGTPCILQVFDDYSERCVDSDMCPCINTNGKIQQAGDEWDTECEHW